MSSSLFVSCSSFGGDYEVMYQPLNRDFTPSIDSKFPTFIKRVGQQNTSAIFIQWLQYGDETFGGINGRLATRMEVISKYMPLRLGIYLPEKYYNDIGTVPDQSIYIDTVLDQTRITLEQWQPWIDKNNTNILGFYLPFELNDWDFREPTSRSMIVQKLADFKSEYFPRQSLSISLFISGIIGPEAYSEWVSQLLNIGYDVWVQDGSGTKSVATEVRQAYLDALPCDAGIIVEAFKQTSTTGTFSAEPKTSSELNTDINAINSCHKITIFSLRYLPIKNNPLTY